MYGNSILKSNIYKFDFHSKIYTDIISSKIFSDKKIYDLFFFEESKVYNIKNENYFNQNKHKICNIFYFDKTEIKSLDEFNKNEFIEMIEYFKNNITLYKDGVSLFQGVELDKLFFLFLLKLYLDTETIHKIDYIEPGLYYINDMNFTNDYGIFSYDKIIYNSSTFLKIKKIKDTYIYE